MDQVGKSLLRFTVEVADNPSANESGVLTTWEIAERFPKIADLVTELDFYSLAYIVGTTRVTVSFVEEPDNSPDEPEWNKAACPGCGTLFAPYEAIVLANTEKVGCPSCRRVITYTYQGESDDFVWC